MVVGAGQYVVKYEIVMVLGVGVTTGTVAGGTVEV